MPVLLPVVALFGLAVGSFLNVVVHRVPRGESIVSPPSHCPRCGTAVRARHNIPVLGWSAPGLARAIGRRSFSDTTPTSAPCGLADPVPGQRLGDVLHR